MLAKLKYNAFIFFLRIRTKRIIKQLKQDLGDLSWHLSVEKIDDQERVKKYKEIELWIFIKENTLKGLQYDWK